jgi:hypothetical protein
MHVLSEQACNKGHVPQSVYLQPLKVKPHCAPNAVQLCATQWHWPLVSQVPLHAPQEPPQPSAPHCLPVQLGTHGLMH